LKRQFVTLVFFILSHIAFSQCEVLVWSDEFNGTGLPNSTDWGFDLGTGSGGWGNQEIQTYTNSTANVRQENGNLVIEALKSGSTWTSARVKTQGKKSFKYGKFVFRAKLPTGSGTWPALWMLGENISSVGWPTCGEIDIMEHAGKNQNVVQAALHTPSSNGNTVNKGSKTISTASTEFHEYSVSWNATRITLSIDGILFYTYNPSPKTAANWPFDANQFFIMNIAMGGTFGSDPKYETNGLKNGIDPAINLARMEVDYVRVYEERSEPQIIGPLFVKEQQQDIRFEAPDYGLGVAYNWTVPSDAQIISGQGTNKITVNWGIDEGSISLDVAGYTGCANNSTSIFIGTTISPEGEKFLVDDFSDNIITGWSSSGSPSEIVFDESNSHLKVNYHLSGIKSIQYEFPKAVDFSNFSLLKIPISVNSSSETQQLVATLVDGNGNETTTTTFNLDIIKKDGEFHTYSFEFTGLWADNNPIVDSRQVKLLKIYILGGTGEFRIDDVFFFSTLNPPNPPSGFNFEAVTGDQFELSWFDISNAAYFHIYRSSQSNGTYVRYRSNIKSSEIPYLLTLSDNINYFKVSGVNSVGESAKSDEILIVTTVTDITNILERDHLYPNPSFGLFVFSLPDNLSYELAIYDSNGRLIDFRSSRNGNDIQIELMQKMPGIYYLRMNVDNEVVVRKVMVQ